MVILLEPFGQRSNKLFQHIHLDSFCREYGIKFFNPCLKKMYNDYPVLRHSMHKEWLNPLFSLLQTSCIFRFVKVNHFDVEDQNHWAIIRKRKIVLCTGWCFRSFSTTIKYRSYYQKIFYSALNYTSLADKYLKKNSLCEVLIGVHIRRGDYKEFTSGIYYYDNSTYIDKIRQLIECLGTENCKILVFSDDRSLNINMFNECFKNLIISEESEIADHYLMSKCDYIIGPPSTFSLWASYIGEKPIYHIRSREDKISLDSFSVCNG